MRTGSTAAIGTCSVPSVNEPVVHTFGTLGTSVVINGARPAAGRDDAAHDDRTVRRGGRRRHDLESRP